MQSQRRSSSGKKAPRLHGPGVIRGHTPGSVTYVNMEQCESLENLFNTNSTLVAAKNVIHSQILSGGITLRRSGATIPLTPEFQRHIDTHWLPFVKTAIDMLLVCGFVVVSYELDDSEEEEVHIPSLARAVPNRPGEGAFSSNVPAPPQRTAKTRAESIIPNALMLGCFQLTFELTGERNYRRRYNAYNLSSSALPMQEGSVRIYVKDHPDRTGNVNSAVAATAPMCGFANTILDLAVRCEVGRAAPAIVTQARKTSGSGANANPRDMFFDTESRNLHDQSLLNDDQFANSALRAQLESARTHNAGYAFDPARTSQVNTSIDRGRRHPNLRDASFEGKMLTLPGEQEMASYPLPQSRTDLCDILRLTMDGMAASMGVPSSLLFESRFSAQSTAQLSLLNATVQQLAKTLDSILTRAYSDIYGAEEGVELVTTTSPLAAADEVLRLYSSGLADFKVAAPLALNAIGVGQGGIIDAIRRREQAEADGTMHESGFAQSQSLQAMREAAAEPPGGQKTRSRSASRDETQRSGLTDALPDTPRKVGETSKESSSDSSKK